MTVLLFDMDGVLVDSHAVSERIWRDFAAEHGLDPDAFLPGVHGRRSIDTLRGLVPLLPPSFDLEAAAELVDGREARELDGVVAVPGAGELLAGLPSGSWTVVTSALRSLAEARLGAVGLPVPGTIVTADQVRRGKPDPQGYLLGAARLGARPEDAVVVEDAPAGIAAARAAGMAVVGVTTTLSAARMPPVDAVVDDLTELPAALSALGRALPA